MNILELDSFNLADAVKFNDLLNPRIWQGEKMRPEVREQLLKIAADFKESLGVDDLDIKDITISGSNAGYTYTPHSDIDLHLVVRMPDQCDEVYQELFNAKKYQYNDEHDIKIGGYNVELYVQPADQEHVSAGVYSLKNNDWIHIPRKIAATIKDTVVKDKYDSVKTAIDSALKSNDIAKMRKLWSKIKEMRQAGLAKNGELGPENLAFKMLRTQGDLGKLKDSIRRAKDAELSLNERKKKKKKVKYGFARSWAPAFDFTDGGDGGGVEEDVTLTPDGVGASTRMFLSEKDVPSYQDIIRDFIKYARKEIGLKKLPRFKLHKDPQWSIDNQSFGRYVTDTDTVDLCIGGRHIMDILRTLAHELQHRKQDEIEKMPPDAGATGSPYENEAHVVAGVLMRNYADLHPEYFEDVPVSESASGYIPTKKQAKDPRYAMALTVDIKPGQVGKEANKMALKTDSQGRPGLLMKTANMIGEATKSKSHGYNSTPMSQVPGEQEDDLGNQEATGPEFEPQMPAGTTKIEVGDLTDWYRLGMDISDLDDADPEDYNQGPPQTVVVFPSDEAEQGYLKQFKRLGLKTHDIDPDVAGGEDTTGKHLNKALAEELAAFKEQDLFEIKMTGKNLSKLASDIKDVKVGLEFEMIVPDATVEDDGDMEPDYDQDERVRDIDDCVNFFDDGDYNSSSDIRRLRDQMYEDYWEWRAEQIDNDWYNGEGREYFEEYLDREDPFDRDEALEEAEDYVRENNPDIEPGTDEYQQAVSERLNEMEEAYAQEQWDDQGRNFDAAREEWEDEQGDNYSEQDWLESQGIRYASNVESTYGNVTWPYYTSNSSDGETDIKRIALEFMNESGLPYTNIAIANRYHGRYELWDGKEWIDYGEEKPDFCFTIEPDGSLSGNSAGDAGLEFVSPPIPLDQVNDTMSKVQQWAARNGVYTGKANKTSMHTNISVPGYDLDKLDYVKAALLLGDEYVLREFDRIGNTYAAPAIEKVRELVKQNPDKAKQLLDKMKSQLNAAASKLIHSGVTNKFTSINTKDNRIEFRSPGGNYLNDIAKNPKKMQDTINRMVVALDAAMDPNKYKEEYQKKLYKMLTGQQSGREAKTGAKQEMKASDKDLLNIFSRYAAGELPKQALKSFVRQAQLERNVEKGKATGKMWWKVSRPGYFASIEVVANSREEAIEKAIEPSNYPDWAQAKNTLKATPVRPYQEEPKGPTLNNRPSNPDGNYVIVSQQDESVPVYRFMASGDQDAITVLRQWIAANPGLFRWTFKKDAEQALGQPGAAPEQPAETNQGNWGIWIDGRQSFARQPGTHPAGQEVPLRRFPTQQAAANWLENHRRENVGVRSDIEIREIEPAAQTQTGRYTYRVYTDTGETVGTFQSDGIQGSTGAMFAFRNYLRSIGRDSAAGFYYEEIGRERQSGQFQEPSAGRGDLTPRGPGPWEIYRISDGSSVRELSNTDRMAAGEEARTALGLRGEAPELYGVRTRPTQNSLPGGPNYTVANDPRDAQQGGTIDVAGEPTTGSEVGQTYNPSGTGEFTGQWLVLNPNNQVLYKFGGVGNSQSDANRYAMRWLTQNPRQMVDGVTVVPEMG
jgi:hypothetical protein